MDAEMEQAKKLLSKFGFRDDYSEIDVEAVHAAVGASQEHFGLVRLKIGALLIAVKDKELWRGRARSFMEYLDDEKIKRSAARQYMKVAEKLLLELKLSDSEIRSLSKCSMTTLVKACERMDKTNKDEIIALLETLSDKDAKHVLDDFEAHQKPLTAEQSHPPQIRKMVTGYYDLPQDLRMSFLESIGITKFEMAKP